MLLNKSQIDATFGPTLLRHYTPKLDDAFVRTTFRYQMRQAPEFNVELMDNTLPLLLDLMFVRVASLADDPDHIMGYAFGRDQTLGFVYVRKSLRGQGLGQYLTSQVTQSPTHYLLAPPNVQFVHKLGLDKISITQWLAI